MSAHDTFRGAAVTTNHQKRLYAACSAVRKLVLADLARSTRIIHTQEYGFILGTGEGLQPLCHKSCGGDGASLRLDYVRRIDPVFICDNLTEPLIIDTAAGDYQYSSNKHESVIVSGYKYS